ncbi:MAG: hypothetical protein R2853_08870 [Thermomicrobiales bacterium]
MDAREFDELITRIAQAASRRTAVKGALGGALAGVGVAAAASAKDKAKKGRKGKGKGRGEVASEHNAHHGKRTLCLCKEETSTTVTTLVDTTGDGRALRRAQARDLVCETKRLKKKKAKRALRNNPGSYRGPCEEATTTSTSSTSSTSTSIAPTTTEEP